MSNTNNAVVDSKYHILMSYNLYIYFIIDKNEWNIIIIIN